MAGENDVVFMGESETVESRRWRWQWQRQADRWNAVDDWTLCWVVVILRCDVRDPSPRIHAHILFSLFLLPSLKEPNTPPPLCSSFVFTQKSRLQNVNHHLLDIIFLNDDEESANLFYFLGFCLLFIVGSMTESWYYYR